jgi:hypothetical protein
MRLIFFRFSNEILYAFLMSPMLATWLANLILIGWSLVILDKVPPPVLHSGVCRGANRSNNYH